MSTIGNTLLTIAGALFLAVCTGCQSHGRTSLESAYDALLRAMGDPALSDEERKVAAAMLRRGNEEVLVALVAHLDDQRIYLHGFLDPSESDDATDPARKRDLKVGEYCLAVLLDCVYGTQRVPKAALPENWKAWAQENKTRTFAQIREDGESRLRALKSQK